MSTPALLLLCDLLACADRPEVARADAVVPVAHDAKPDKAEVTGWLEVSAGYGIEELRRFGETDSDFAGDSFASHDSLFWSVAGHADWKRPMRDGGAIALAAQVRRTAYALDARAGRTAFDLDASVLAPPIAAEVELASGVRLEEFVRGTSPSRSRVTGYVRMRYSPGDQWSFSNALGCRLIRNEGTAALGYDVRTALTRRLSPSASATLRGRYYRERWAVRFDSYRMYSAGASVRYAPTKRLRAELSAFVVGRNYDRPAAGARQSVDIRAGNATLTWSPNKHWSLELASSVKQRRSDPPSRHKKGRVVALSARSMF